jgi:hypothetical protein
MRAQRDRSTWRMIGESRPNPKNKSMHRMPPSFPMSGPAHEGKGIKAEVDVVSAVQIA